VLVIIVAFPSVQAWTTSWTGWGTLVENLKLFYKRSRRFVFYICSIVSSGMFRFCPGGKQVGRKIGSLAARVLRQGESPLRRIGAGFAATTALRARQPRTGSVIPAVSDPGQIHMGSFHIPVPQR
jgi:hypothetical protein